MLYFTDWENDEGHYRRYELSKNCFYWAEDSKNGWKSHISEIYNTKEEVMAATDKIIIKQGHKIITNERAEKLRSLI